MTKIKVKKGDHGVTGGGNYCYEILNLEEINSSGELQYKDALYVVHMASEDAVCYNKWLVCYFDEESKYPNFLCPVPVCDRIEFV